MFCYILFFIPTEIQDFFKSQTQPTNQVELAIPTTWSPIDSMDMFYIAFLLLQGLEYAVLTSCRTHCLSERRLCWKDTCVLWSSVSGTAQWAPPGTTGEPGSHQEQGKHHPSHSVGGFRISSCAFTQFSLQTGILAAVLMWGRWVRSGPCSQFQDPRRDVIYLNVCNNYSFISGQLLFSHWLSE